MNRIAPAIALFVALVYPCQAQDKLVYLGCDLPEKPEHPARHFDFTLDEGNRTVSTFSEGVALNKVKAVFSGDTVTWTIGGLETITRTISRTSLMFTEIDMVGEGRWRTEGTCKAVTPRTA